MSGPTPTVTKRLLVFWAVCANLGHPPTVADAFVRPSPTTTTIARTTKPASTPRGTALRSTWDQYYSSYNNNNNGVNVGTYTNNGNSLGINTAPSFAEPAPMNGSALRFRDPAVSQPPPNQGLNYNNPNAPRNPGGPLIRYSDLSEGEKESLSLDLRVPRNPSYYNGYTPEGEEERPLAPPASVPMPETAQEIQGGSRGTWTPAQHHDRVQVNLETPDGRPLQADVEVWQGPDNTPQKLRVFTEDGRLRPFATLFETPRGTTVSGHSISVQNTGPPEFPLVAGVEGQGDQGTDTTEDLAKGTRNPFSLNPGMAIGSSAALPSTEMRSGAMTDYAGRSMDTFLDKNQEIHGGHLKTYPFDASAKSVEVNIRSEGGLPIMAVIELWQGPGDIKTLAQVYSDDGLSKPFSAVLETPGDGNTIAIRNMGPDAYPFHVELSVYEVDDAAYSYSGSTYQAYGALGNTGGYNNNGSLSYNNNYYNGAGNTNYNNNFGGGGNNAFNSNAAFNTNNFNAFNNNNNRNTFNNNRGF